MRRAWLLLVAIAAICGCVSTSLRSMKDPAFSGAFRRIVVIADFEDLALRQDVERGLVKSLRERGFTGLSFVDMQFSLRDVSGDGIDAAFADMGIDGVLTFSPGDTGSSSVWIPPTSVTYGSAVVAGKTVTGSAQTYTLGGYSVESPWAKFNAKLYDRAARRSVWMASFKSEGGQTGRLVRSMTEKAAADLVAQGLLR